MGIFGRNLPGRIDLPVGLTASAVRVPADTSEKQGYRRLIQAWQQTALGTYESMGECWFPSQFYGRALSRIRLYVGEMKPDGSVEPFENAKTDEILGRVQDPGGGRSNMLRTYGQLRFVTGESYLLVTDDEGSEAWEMVSVNELRINPGAGYTRYRAPQIEPEQLVDVPDDAFEPVPDGAVVYRFWQRSPNFSALADAPTRGVLTLYDLLSRLTMAEMATAKSRAANAGILWLANEIKFPAVGAQTEDPNQDVFMRNLTTAITAALRDVGEASAAIPLVVRVPSEYIENQKGFYHMKFRDPAEISESELIEKTIRRIATGLDIPPEIMLGLEDTNHWNAWMIQDETWQSHLGPAAQGFCDDLTSAYFRPACKAAKVANWQNLVVTYDASEVINHPDRGKDAIDAFHEGAIGYKALREALGMKDGDAPNEDELYTMVAVMAHDVGALNPQKEVPESTGTEQSDVETGEEVDEGAGESNAVKPGPPEEPVDARDEVMAASIVAMGEMAVERCRERAGARLRGSANGCDACKEKIKGVPADLIASVFGFEAAAELDAKSPSELVAGGTDTFVKQVVLKGVSETYARRLASLIEMHAARTLWQEHPPALPSGFMEAARRAT